MTRLSLLALALTAGFGCAPPGPARVCVWEGPVTLDLVSASADASDVYATMNLLWSPCNGPGAAATRTYRIDGTTGESRRRPAVPTSAMPVALGDDGVSVEFADTTVVIYGGAMESVLSETVAVGEVLDADGVQFGAIFVDSEQ